MENVISALKKFGVLVLAGAVLLTAMDYYAGQRKERCWDIEWKKSPESFRLSAIKRKGLRKER